MAAYGTTVWAKPMNHGKTNCITFNTPAPKSGINYGFSLSMTAYSDAHCSIDQVPGTYGISDLDPNPDTFDPQRCDNQMNLFKEMIGSVKVSASSDGNRARVHVLVSITRFLYIRRPVSVSVLR